MLGVAGFVENATDVLEQVQRRLNTQRARQTVERSRSALVDIRDDLERISDLTQQMDERSSWVLNPRWHPVMFQVASSRDTILLTVAINAVRVVSQACDRILEDRWPKVVGENLEAQRRRLVQVERDLLEARSGLFQAEASNPN